MPVEATQSYGLLGSGVWRQRSFHQPRVATTWTEAPIPYVDGAFSLDQCRIGSTKLDTLRAGFHVYDLRSGGVPIPYGALIVSASWWAKAYNTSVDANPAALEFSAFQPDGRWNVPAPDPAAVGTGSDCRGFSIVDISLVDLIVPVPDVGDQGFVIREHATRGAHRVGQCVHRPIGSPGGPATAAAKLRIRRVGSPGGNIRVAVYAARAGGGADNRATGPALTRSAVLAADAIATGATGQLVLFSLLPGFGGEGAIAHPPGTSLCYMLEGDYTPTGTDWIEVLASASSDAPYRNGSLVMGTDAANETAVAGGWQHGTYGSLQALPFFRDNAGGDLAGLVKASSDVPPVPGGELWPQRLGSALTLTVPLFATAGVEYEVPGLAPLFQAAVNSDYYRLALAAGAEAPVGLGINSLAGLIAGQDRSYDDSRVVIHWIDRPPGTPRFDRIELEPAVRAADVDLPPAIRSDRWTQLPGVRVADVDLDPAVRSARDTLEPAVRSSRSRLRKG